MNRKIKQISFAFGFVVLVALLIQSIHSFHHIAEEFSVEKCQHDYSKNKTQLTHSHEKEHCFVCEFSLSNTNEIVTYFIDFNDYKCNYRYSTTITYKLFCPYKGSLFLLRAPPSFIV